MTGATSRMTAAASSSDRDDGASSSSARLAWVDIARGIGILLVVYGHGQRSIDPTIMPPWMLIQNRLIYAFHMPLFFLVSGLFLWPSLRRGWRSFLRSRAATIVWPYFLWSLVSGLIELTATPWVNSPVTLHDLFLIPVQPIEQYWFLYALFLCQLVALATYPSRAKLAIVAAVGFILAQFFYLGMITRSLLFLPFVVAGIGSAGVLRRLAQVPGRGQALLLLGSLAAFALLAPGIAAGLTSPPRMLAAAMAGSLMVLAVAMLVARTGRGGLLALLGEASLAIYVLHTIFSAGARILLGFAGVPTASMTMLAVVTFAGVAFPYAIWRWSDSRGLGVRLGLGSAGPLRGADPRV